MESECELVVKAKDSEKKRVTLALVIFLMQGHHLAVSLLVRPPFLFLTTLNSEYYVPLIQSYQWKLLSFVAEMLKRRLLLTFF